MRDGQTLVEGKKVDGLYIVNTIQESANPAQSDRKSELELWHRRFGHLNISALKILHSKSMVKHLPINLYNDKFTCEVCIQGKQFVQPFHSKNSKTASEVLELIHTDLCGPMKVESMSMKVYFVSFIDDYSRKVHVKFLRTKSEYLEAFLEFKNKAELESSKRIKSLRSDNVKEINSKVFLKCLKENGIQHQLTVAYTPQQMVQLSE